MERKVKGNMCGLFFFLILKISKILFLTSSMHKFNPTEIVYIDEWVSSLAIGPKD